MHAPDFGKMQYPDGTFPFWYINLDEFSEVVKQCTGEEAAPVAVVIQKLTHEFERLTAPKVDVPVVDEE
jgi:hypothetical protein